MLIPLDLAYPEVLQLARRFTESCVQNVEKGLAQAGVEPAIARSNFAVIRELLHELFAPYFTTRRLPSFDIVLVFSFRFSKIV